MAEYSRKKVCECGKEIYFLKTKNKRFIPINKESLTELEINDLEAGMERLFKYGVHVTHFETCPLRENYRK